MHSRSASAGPGPGGTYPGRGYPGHGLARPAGGPGTVSEFDFKSCASGFPEVGVPCRSATHAEPESGTAPGLA
eukprot:416733-Rhodomonas_salina.2